MILLKLANALFDDYLSAIARAIQRKVKLLLIGIALIILGAITMHAGFLLILLGFFFRFAEETRFFLPSIYTAFIGLGIGSVLIVAGLYLARVTPAKKC